MSAPMKTIGGRVFSFGTIPAVQAVRVEVAIARVIGEPLFKAFMESQAGGDTESAQTAAASSAIGLLAARMDADELLGTMKLVFGSVACEGKPIVEIDATFTGKNRELWQVFIEALRVNFADFLAGGLFGSLVPEIPKV